MSGAYAAAHIAADLKSGGEAMTLARPAGASVIVRGKRRRPKGAGADPLVGAQAQNLIQIRISNAEIAAAAWPGPPRKGDRLTMAGRQYTLEADADTRWRDGVVLGHYLLVKG